jgi:N-acetylated-alpha-linked acidic dipeptidase
MKAVWAAAIAACVALPGLSAPGLLLRGYPAPDADAERGIEARYLDLPTTGDQLDVLRTIAERPHYAGTPADLALAEYMRDRLRADGIRAELQPFTLRIDTPRELVLELAPPADLANAPPAGARAKRRAFPIAIDLAEHGDPGDPSSGARAAGLPFDAGSGDGDVSAPLVYANYGRESDYATLAAAHVDVHGAVVLVRSGADGAGGLARRAQTQGAAGAIFYTDPQDAGPARGLAAPDGPWQPRGAVERGWLGPGIRIPVVPVSAANAQILLGALDGIPGPPDWTGALAAAYPLARGPGRVHLIVVLNHKRTLVWNTIGVIPGLRGDQSVIVGAHRDAWVFGADANGSGVATVLGVAHGLGYLLRSGWRPQRTIVLAGWDAGELGAAGSREYVFKNRVELPRGCVAYLDAADTVTGPEFAGAGTAALASIVAAAARAVSDPHDQTATMLTDWTARSGGRSPVAAAPAAEGDAQSFLATAGVAVAQMRLRGPFGVAATSYDTLHYATTISDPFMELHRAAAQLYGVAVLRLADAPGVPYDFAAYPSLVRGGFARLTRDARAAGLHLPSAGIHAALGRLAIGIGRFRTTENSPSAWSGGLLAVRTLDALLYGVRGDAGVTLPELTAAVAARDQAQVDAALERTAGALDRAADALTRG